MLSDSRGYAKKISSDHTIVPTDAASALPASPTLTNGRARPPSDSSTRPFRRKRSPIALHAIAPAAEHLKVLGDRLAAL